MPWLSQGSPHSAPIPAARSSPEENTEIENIIASSFNEIIYGNGK